MVIKLAGPSIEFSLSVSNQTPHKIAEVWYPILGGFTGIGDRQDSQEMIPVAGGSSNTNLFHTFEGGRPAGTGHRLRGGHLVLSHLHAHALDQPL